MGKAFQQQLSAAACSPEKLEFGFIALPNYGAPLVRPNAWLARLKAHISFCTTKAEHSALWQRFTA